MAEDAAAKFEAAWAVFAMTCAHAIAPEATFQAWFAHYLISQFGLDRVAREPIFKHLRSKSTYRDIVGGGEVKLDAVVLREPGVALGHYVRRGGDGMATLGQLLVISELKVAATQAGGLSHRQVAQDVYKLSLLLDEARGLGLAEPLAYVGILDNNSDKRYRRSLLDARLEKRPPDSNVRILFHSIHDS